VILTEDYEQTCGELAHALEQLEQARADAQAHEQRINEQLIPTIERLSVALAKTKRRYTLDEKINDRGVWLAACKRAEAAEDKARAEAAKRRMWGVKLKAAEKRAEAAEVLAVRVADALYWYEDCCYSPDVHSDYDCPELPDDAPETIERWRRQHGIALPAWQEEAPTFTPATEDDAERLVVTHVIGADGPKEVKR